MFRSIFDDVKGVFQSGNMLTRIITVNVIIYIVINLIILFDFNKDVSGFSGVLIRKLSLVSSPLDLLLQFWALITHMFLHIGFSHILWNMLFLYWFGRIVGDFLNDRRILPLYILGGLAGGLAFILWDQIGGTQGVGYAYGASAAVMCMVTVAATTSPDYIMNLLLIGPVRLKYVAFAIVLIDVFALGNNVNTGGHFGHLGGAFFGAFYVSMLRKGTDLTEPLQKIIDKISNLRQPRIKKTPRSKFTVYKSSDDSKAENKNEKSFSQQEELDRILDKINQHGYEKLTKEEKEFLYQASKKK